MKTLRFWVYAWPCLCLLLSFFLVSCAVKHNLQPPGARNQTSPKDTVAGIWEMEVRLVPRYAIDDLYMEGIKLLAQPYDVQLDLLDNRRCSRILTLHYRICDKNQLQKTRADLMATGMIAEIKIIKITN
jgi:hypothetical protein